MNKQHVLAQLEVLRAEIASGWDDTECLTMTQQDRNLLGIQLRNALQRVSSKYRGCTVWIEADGKRATIANLTAHAPTHTSVKKIRERISQGRHQ